MGASHTLVGVAATIASFALVVTSSTFVDTLGADETDRPYVGLWVYTPYVDPGANVAAKLFLQGGDDIAIADVTGTVDDRSLDVTETSVDRVRPSKRFGMGKVTAELSIRIPLDLPPGPHQLKLRTQGRCSGSDYSRACGNVEMESPIQVGDTLVPRALALLRALVAALVMWFGAPRAFRGFVAWAKAAGKNGGILVPAFILGFVTWGYSGYPLFARPLGAALSVSSTALYAAAMVSWLAIPQIAARRRRGRAADAGLATATLRFVDDVQPVDQGAGYREAGAARVRPSARSLDDVGHILRATTPLRLRRVGDRLVPGFLRWSPVSVSAADPADVVPSGLEIRAPASVILGVARVLADRIGPLDLVIDGTTMRVEPGMSLAALHQELLRS